MIGNIAHLAVAFRGRSKDYKVANETLSLWEFIKMERAAIFADFICSMGLVYVADEWINSDFVMGKIKTAFVVVGFTGSYLILQLGSVSKNRLRSKIDEKSNIADFGSKDKPQ